MRDYNFFSVYIDHKKTEKKRLIYSITAGVLVAASVAGLLGYNIVQIKSLKGEIELKKSFVDNAEVVKRNKAVIAKNNTVKLLNEYGEIVKGIESVLGREYLNQVKVFDTIGDSIPEKIFISSIEIDRDGVSISGTTGDRDKVAYLQHNLRGQDIIRDVHLSLIHNDEDKKTYSFDLKCYFEDVINNEGN